MRVLKQNPVLRLVNSYLVDSPQPINISYLWNFGSLLALCLGFQIVTGVFLVMHYTPHVDFAFDSVEHIMRVLHSYSVYNIFNLFLGELLLVCTNFESITKIDHLYNNVVIIDNSFNLIEFLINLQDYNQYLKFTLISIILIQGFHFYAHFYSTS